MATKEQKEAFVKNHYQNAVDGGGGPWLGILGQAALESGWGLHAPGNMLFGVKAGPSWKGKRQLLRTWEAGSTNKKPSLQAGESIIATYAPGADGNPWKTKWAFRCMMYFRAYGKAVESFQDHAKLLAGERYSKASKETKPDAWADKVAAAGYATAPGYADSLKAVMEEITGIVKGLAMQPKTKGGGLVVPLLLVGVASVAGVVIYRKLKTKKEGVVIPFRQKLLIPKAA